DGCRDVVGRVASGLARRLKTTSRLIGTCTCTCRTGQDLEAGGTRVVGRHIDRVMS
ncbi:hypothetical protein COCCADRAFT_102077, partial [Bipolaris zeicola 26-R-13]